MKTTESYTLILALLLSISLSVGCGGMKMGGGKSQGSLYESFYIGEGREQYYIKALIFDSESEKGAAAFDFTIRTNKNKSDSCRVNFSLYSSLKEPGVERLSISNDTEDLTEFDCTRFFKRIDKKAGFEHRYASYMTTDDISRLFEFPEESKIQLSGSGESIQLRPSSKSQRRMIKLWNSVFQLL